GIVKHAVILMPRRAIDAIHAAGSRAYRAAGTPAPRFGFIFRAAVLPWARGAYCPRKQIHMQFQGPMKNLIDAAAEVGNFKILLSAFKSASLIDMLRSPGQYTVFAPTDAAFKRLPAGSLEAMFKDARTLKPFLCNHMMRGVKAANDILPGELTPLEGKVLRASLDGSAILVNGVQIVQSDIRASNGVIHAMYDVLVPLNPILAAVA